MVSPPVPLLPLLRLRQLRLLRRLLRCVRLRQLLLLRQPSRLYLISPYLIQVARLRRLCTREALVFTPYGLEKSRTHRAARQHHGCDACRNGRLV